MAFDYGEMQDVATELLGEFSQGVMRLFPGSTGGGPSYDPGAGAPADPIPMQGTARTVSAEYVRGGLAVATDLQVTTAVLPDVKPKNGMHIEIDGLQYEIIEFLPKPAAGIAVAWVFIVRG